MKTNVLMYHDINDKGNPDSSGFPGRDSAKYKIDLASFEEHLHAIGLKLGCSPCLVEDLKDLYDAGNRAGCWMISFDDGGVSSVEAANSLELRGWRGHFFVTTEAIGRPSFLNSQHIRDLRARGHLIGSHSCSHPIRMGDCEPMRIFEEWRDSISRLEDILSEPIVTASVPGGYYNKQVATQASNAGVRFLFTSEPISKSCFVRNCMVVGRYAIRSNTSAEDAALLASGDRVCCGSQWFSWNAKKLARRVGGQLYERLRSRMLKHL